MHTAPILSNNGFYSLKRQLIMVLRRLHPNPFAGVGYGRPQTTVFTPATI